MNDQPSTVGILYPGEMGSSLGRLLLAGGHRVVTTLAGRSERTRRACRQAGLEVLEDVEGVVAASEMVVSLVPPAAAWDVCRRFGRSLARTRRPPLYVDANSISPQSARKIEHALNGWGVPMVDAAIHGLASRLQSHGTVYVSGAQAAVVERLFSQVVKVRRLGDSVGTASMLKMLLGGMSKGLAALFLQVALAARKADLVDEFLESYREFCPGVMLVIDRLLPTYPCHARRRADEMCELEDTIRSLGLRQDIVREVRHLIGALGETSWPAESAGDNAPPTVSGLLERLHLSQFLHTGAPLSCTAGLEQTLEAR